MIKLCELFDISYGHSLELNRLTQTNEGINFVSRTSQNNGVSARVIQIPEIEPMSAGKLTVALGGSVLETFLQPEPFYTGFHIFCLTPLVNMTTPQKLYYCACIRANKYRYNYGRQANRTLRDIDIPDISEIPTWINKINVDMYEGVDIPVNIGLNHKLYADTWQFFELQSLFEIKKGKRLTKVNQLAGNTPYIGAIDKNNGVSSFIGQQAIHEGGTISVSYNGSVAEAFYQPEPFWATDDVNVLYPKFELTPAIALFIATLIRQEKYRFNYGRKWHLERMRESQIRLPVKPDGTPDWDFMEQYIKSLPYSSQIE